MRMDEVSLRSFPVKWLLHIQRSEIGSNFVLVNFFEREYGIVMRSRNVEPR